MAREKSLSAYQEKALISLLEDEIANHAKQSLLSFTAYTMPRYEINWHHRLLCSYLDDFCKGKIERLMVFMPPRHGKSELVSRRLPAFLLGQNPDLQIITASYSDSLAAQMNRDVQRIIESPEYSFLFPETRLGSISDSGVRYMRNSGMFEVIGRRGRYKSAGIGTGITGMGADIAIIDDPVKDQTEADSKQYRERAWNWYSSVLHTRLEKNARVLFTMTRWHEDDLAGRLLAQSESDPDADKWIILNLPALKEDKNNPDDPRKIGEPLWESKYNQKKMNQIRHSVGTRVWNALYQQRPSAMEGNLVLRDWLKIYNTRPEFDEICISADLTYKKGEFSDFAVVEAWGRKGPDLYLLEQIRGQMNFPEQLDAIREMSNRYPTAAKYIEEAANGAAVIQTLKEEIMGIIPIKPRTSKEARLQAVAHLYEAGNVYYPNPKFNKWVETNIEELVSFPNALNDDTVDTATMAISQLAKVNTSLNRIMALSKL
jgi:predicted phage terminase large subunit-like protein